MKDYYWDKDGITSDIIDSLVIETGCISDDTDDTAVSNIKWSQNYRFMPGEKQIVQESAA